MYFRYLNKKISSILILFCRKYEGTLRHKIHYTMAKTVTRKKDYNCLLTYALEQYDVNCHVTLLFVFVV